MRGAGSGERVTPGASAVLPLFAAEVRVVNDLALACARESPDFQLLRATEGQSVLLLVPVDANKVAEVNLLSRQKVCQRIDHMTFDGALQVPRSVALIRALLQQELTPGIRDAEQKNCPLAVFQDALLHLAELRFSSTFSSCSRLKWMNTTTLSSRFMNSGENLRRAASTAVRFDLFTRSRLQVSR